MDRRRGSHAAGIAGLVSVGLELPSALVVIVGGNYPAPDTPAARVTAYLGAHRTAYLSSLVLEAISLGFFLWFLGGLRQALEAADDGAWGLASVAFAGGIAFTVCTLVEDAALAALVPVVHSGGSPSTVVALRWFAFFIEWPFARPLAVVLLSATSFAGSRTRILPPSIVVLSAVAALANAVFIPSVFVEHGIFVPGGSLAHLTATLLLEVWVLGASLALLDVRLFPQHRGD